MSEQGAVGAASWGLEAADDTVEVKGSLAIALMPLDDADRDLDGDDDIDGRGKRRRRSRARARTISIRRLSKTELNLGRMMYPEEQYWRPESRGECADME
ncbi:MAG TPA: hypothetical protein VFX59_15165, partial [Polyangiales bacterium]|nr:hypothetical protein [Polyangiales bacterium]